jgi:hypothetical protein
MDNNEVDAEYRQKMRLEYERIMKSQAESRGETYVPNLEATKFLADMTDEEKISLSIKKERIALEKVQAQQTALQLAREQSRARKAREEESRKAFIQDLLLWPAIIVFFIFLGSTCSGSGGGYSSGYDDWYCGGARC